ncbi:MULTISPECIES: hypothetical protein [unclassified Luteimonas]
MNHDAEWLTLTPQGVLHAFDRPDPDPARRALQGLLAGRQAPTRAAWCETAGPDAPAVLADALERHWIQPLRRCVAGPDIRLDDFAQHVIAPLSGERRAVLASESGFSLGHAGLSQDEADATAAAAADFSGYALRQGQRGWDGAQRSVSFFRDPQMLLPEWSFVPFWVDGSGYWLAIGGEPLLNNLAMVELVWSIRLAANRFAAPA